MYFDIQQATIFYQELEIQSRDEELVLMQAHSEFVQKNLILRNVDLERQLEFLMAFYNSMNSSSDSDATNHRNNLNENKSGYYDNNVSNRDDTSRRLHSVHTSDDHLEEEDEEDVDDNDNEAEGGGCNGYDEEKKVWPLEDTTVSYNIRHYYINTTKGGRESDRVE